MRPSTPHPYSCVCTTAASFAHTPSTQPPSQSRQREKVKRVRQQGLRNNNPVRQQQQTVHTRKPLQPPELATQAQHNSGMWGQLCTDRQARDNNSGWCLREVGSQGLSLKHDGCAGNMPCNKQTMPRCNMDKKHKGDCVVAGTHCAPGREHHPTHHHPPAAGCCWLLLLSAAAISYPTRAEHGTRMQHLIPIIGFPGFSAADRPKPGNNHTRQPARNKDTAAPDTPTTSAVAPAHPHTRPTLLPAQLLRPPTHTSNPAHKRARVGRSNPNPSKPLGVFRGFTCTG
jgi:hypothetical protein